MAGCGIEFHIWGQWGTVHWWWEKLWFWTRCLHPSAIQILKGKTYIHYLGTCENRLKGIQNFLLGWANCYFRCSGQRSDYWQKCHSRTGRTANWNWHWSSITATRCLFHSSYSAAPKCTHLGELVYKIGIKFALGSWIGQVYADFEIFRLCIMA